jgi:hypothetical protein
MAQGFFLGRGYPFDLTARLTPLTRTLVPTDYVAVVGRGDGDFGRSGVSRGIGGRGVAVIHGDDSLSSRGEWKKKHDAAWKLLGHRRSDLVGGPIQS